MSNDEDAGGQTTARPSPLTLRLPVSLPKLPEFPDIAAFHNLQLHAEKERSKLKLSRMSFFRDAVRIRGSVLPKILPSVFGVTLWAACIFTADYYFDRKWKTSSAIVGPLSVVVGLLLVFRNSTSYDRWYEARKLWASTTSDCRSLARYLWANVDVRGVTCDERTSSLDSSRHAPSVYGTARTHRVGTNGKSRSEDAAEETVIARALSKKQKSIRLLILFLYSLAHELRGEPGVDWSDYEGVLPDEMRQLWDSAEASTLKNEADWAEWKRRSQEVHQEDGQDDTIRAQPYANETLRSLAPEELEAQRSHGDAEAGTSKQEDQPRDWFSRMRRYSAHEKSPLLPKPSPRTVPPPAMGLPLFALYEVGRYIASARKAGMLNDAGPAGFSLANSQLASLTTGHAALTRIAACTIPVIYGIHLKQCECVAQGNIVVWEC